MRKSVMYAVPIALVTLMTAGGANGLPPLSGPI
jgi:hypothetical protein